MVTLKDIKLEKEGKDQGEGGKAKYWKITSMDFLFLELSIGLLLYPGSFGYITDDQKGQLPKFALKMVTLTEITDKEYEDKIGGQGILGLG